MQRTLTVSVEDDDGTSDIMLSADPSTGLAELRIGPRGKVLRLSPAELHDLVLAGNEALAVIAS